jgi:O-antigen/teichoic acid export membrane protein
MIKKYISKTLFLTIGPGIILMLLIPQIIRIYLGDNWTEAGRFCQLIIPYAVGALISGSLAFVPNIFNKQLKSLIIDVVYLLMRTGALAVGIVLRNVYIAVGLYALAGVMVVSYQIFWYRKLLIESDRIIGIQG